MKFVILLFVSTTIFLAAGCGAEKDQAPTAQEVADFKGKPISAEQKARGMAAAMGGAGTKAAKGDR